MGTVLETVVISRPTVTGDSSGLQGLPGMGTTRSGFQADHHKIQKTTQNKENGRDQPETIQNQTKGSESSRDQHKIHKTTQNGETDRDQPKTIQNQTNAARAAKTITKYRKPHKTGNMAETSPKPYKT